MARQRPKLKRNRIAAASRRRQRNSKQETTTSDEVDAKPDEQVEETNVVPTIDEPEEVEDENNNMKKRRIANSEALFDDEPPPFTVDYPELPGNSQMLAPSSAPVQAPTSAEVQEVNTSADPLDESQTPSPKRKYDMGEQGLPMEMSSVLNWTRRLRSRPQWKDELQRPISSWDNDNVNDNDNASRQRAWPDKERPYASAVDPYQGMSRHRWNDELNDDFNASNTRRVMFQPMRSPSTLNSVIWGNERADMSSLRRPRAPVRPQWRPAQNMSNFCPQFYPNEDAWEDSELDEEVDFDFDTDETFLF